VSSTPAVLRHARPGASARGARARGPRTRRLARRIPTPPMTTWRPMLATAATILPIGAQWSLEPGRTSRPDRAASGTALTCGRSRRCRHAVRCRWRSPESPTADLTGMRDEHDPVTVADACGVMRGAPGYRLDFRGRGVGAAAPFDDDATQPGRFGGCHDQAVSAITGCRRRRTSKCARAARAASGNKLRRNRQGMPTTNRRNKP
jgi:hypothetical protein